MTNGEIRGDTGVQRKAMGAIDPAIRLQVPWLSISYESGWGCAPRCGSVQWCLPSAYLGMSFDPGGLDHCSPLVLMWSVPVPYMPNNVFSVDKQLQHIEDR